MMYPDDAVIARRLNRPRLLVEAPIVLTPSTLASATRRLGDHGLFLKPGEGGYWLESPHGRPRLLPDDTVELLEPHARRAWIATTGEAGPGAICFNGRTGVVFWRDEGTVTLALAAWGPGPRRFEAFESDPDELAIHIREIEDRDSWLADEMRRCLDRFESLGSLLAMGLAYRHDLPPSLRRSVVVPTAAATEPVSLRFLLDLSAPDVLHAHGAAPSLPEFAARSLRFRGPLPKLQPQEPVDACPEVEWVRRLPRHAIDEARGMLRVAVGLWFDEAVAASEHECPAWKRHVLEHRELLQGASELLARSADSRPLPALVQADRSVRALLPAPIPPVESETLARASLADPEAWWAVPISPPEESTEPGQDSDC